MLQSTETTVALQANDTVHGASKEEYRRMREWLEERIAAGKKKPSAEVVTLSPCLAHLLLARNPLNRPINKSNAIALETDIANGQFAFNGESIVVSREGTLNDGQHRCDRVIKTNKAIETVIVFGPKEETRFTIDTGRSKTASNLLHMKGRKYTTALSAAVSYHLQWQTNGYLSYGGGPNMPTKSQIVTAADELKGMDKSVETTVDSMKTVRSHAVLAFCHYVFKRRAGVDAADEFIQRLIDGENLRKGSPIYYCRNRLLSMNRGFTANERCELIFRCWNRWREGRTMDTFRFVGGKLPKVES